MKKILFSLAILLLPSFAISATRNVVPRATHEGSLGTPAKYWSSIYVDSGSVNEKLYVGSMTVYGTITTTNAVTASVYYGDGSQLSGITAGGGGGGGQIKVVIDSGTVFTTVSTINVTHADFASAFTAATWTVRLSSNVARLDGSSETFNLSSVLNLNAPQLYFNGATGFGGGQDFAEFNVTNTNPRYFIIRNNNNAGSSNLMTTADGTNSKYSLQGNIGPTWNDTNNGAYLQGSAYLALVGSGRYGIIDRNPLAGVQTRYLMYFTSGTVGINTSTQSAYFEVHSTSNFNGELPLVKISSQNAKELFFVSKSSSHFGNTLYVSSMVGLGTINTNQQVNIYDANLTLGNGHFQMGGTFGAIMANQGGGTTQGIKFGRGGDFTGFQGFQSTVSFIAYDPAIPNESGEVGRFSNKFWTFFSTINTSGLVNISTRSAFNSLPIGLLEISSNVIKGKTILPTYDFWSGSFTSRVPIIASSMTATGTITAGQFRGDGSALTGISASAVQSLPLIAGDTGYFAIYSTRSISATQTFQSSVTFSSTSLSIGGNLYHFQSSAPAVNTVLRYDAGGKVFWGKDGGGGGTSNPTFNFTFNAAQANIMGSSQPYISNSTAAASAGVFFDDTSTQAVTWSTILNPYNGGALNADVIYTSSITAGTINWGIFVECKTPSTVGFDYDSESFDVINSTSVTVGGTANMAMKATSVLTNNDSCASGNILRIKLQRSAGDTDTALGKARMRFIRIYE